MLTLTLIDGVDAYDNSEGEVLAKDNREGDLGNGIRAGDICDKLTKLKSSWYWMSLTTRGVSASDLREDNSDGSVLTSSSSSSTG